VPAEAAEPVREGIGGALAVAGQLGEAGAPLLDAARAAFVEGMAPALYLAAGVSLAAAIFTALRGPVSAAEAEPRLHAEHGAPDEAPVPVA